tara:strand:+ start:388 stop:1440 length:1053 start_codon:yes stop_codon:yes gene_type:complete
VTAIVIDGVDIAGKIRKTVSNGVKQLAHHNGIRPGLATILVGNNFASEAYVNSKRKACDEVGIEYFGHNLPDDVSEIELYELVNELNFDSRVHGILVQLPLPDHINSEKILEAININKDVDGFHPNNIGKLGMKNRTPLFVPCTPSGCMMLLEENSINISGSKTVVLGRSNIVGLPVGMLLLNKDATVTFCHSKTKDLPNICREADILIAAVGIPEIVKGDWIKPGSSVIDVGINNTWISHDDDREFTCSSSEKTFIAHYQSLSDKGNRRIIGYLCENSGDVYSSENLPKDIDKNGLVKLVRKNKLVGDVHFDEAKLVAGYLTPVPGGVGPMTIAVLLQNTYNSAKLMYS